MNKYRFFSLVALTLIAAHSAAIALDIPEQKDPAAQLLIQGLMECGKQKLGGESGIEMAKQMGDQANRQIVAYCKEGNRKRAREVAEYYAKTDEGKAAMECAAQMKPLVEQPAVQNLLGVYKQMVNDILNGVIPENVCVGITPQYGAVAG